MHAELWVGYIKERNHLEDLDLDGSFKELARDCMDYIHPVQESV
jgi:hypothetical protein